MCGINLRFYDIAPKSALMWLGVIFFSDTNVRNTNVYVACINYLVLSLIKVAIAGKFCGTNFVVAAD